MIAAGRERASGVEGAQGMVSVDQFQGLTLAVARIGHASVVGVCRKSPEAPPDRPLVLHKSADRKAVQVGDVVTVELRYTNVGGQPMRDVAVSDSMAARLQYVPESARTDRAAGFTTLANEDGSLILRWQFAGDLLPGQSGLIRFQARVR